MPGARKRTLFGPALRHGQRIYRRVSSPTCTFDSLCVTTRVPGTTSAAAGIALSATHTCTVASRCPEVVVGPTSPIEAREQPTAIALDATTIYFSTGNGGIWKIAK